MQIQMATKPTLSDIYDVNKKTGALILGKNRLEDYATKYLAKHCKEALEEPMPLPIDKIIADEKLTIKEVSLSKDLDIFGCCMLLDGQITVYDRETGEYLQKSYPAGTILFDPESEARYGEGAKRNTLIHEILHWEKDRTYFQILQYKNQAASEKLYPIMCRQSKTFYEPPEGKKTKDNEVKWLEWQAHRLAPRILMPKDMFRKKALEIIDSYNNNGNNVRITCDALVDQLSEFFIVSRGSVKLRLEEVGLLDEISEFEDFESLYAEINSTKNFAKLSSAEAYKMLRENPILQEWVADGKFVFADGYFALANKGVIIVEDCEAHLSAKAKRNLEKFVLNIRTQKYVEYPSFKKDYLGYCMLLKPEGVDKRLYTFHPKYQINMDLDPDEVYKAAHDNLTSLDDEIEQELHMMIQNPSKSLCNCLWYLMEKRKWTYPASFSEHTHLNENYHGKIKNDKYNNMGQDVLMAICVGLRLNYQMTQELFRKSDNKELDYYRSPDKYYMRILQCFPFLSIDDFNSLLKEDNIKELGSISRN